MEQSRLESAFLYRPQVTDETVKKSAKDLYGIEISEFKVLDGYDDKNFYIKVSCIENNKFIENICDEGYTLKIMNSKDSEDSSFIEAQHELLKFLNSKEINVPLPVKNQRNNEYSVENYSNDKGYIVRLMEFVPGVVLDNSSASDELIFNVGEFVGNLRLLLKDFKHYGFDQRRSVWMLERATDVSIYLEYVKNDEDRDIAKKTLEQFQSIVLPFMNQLEKGLIHGDINRNNIITKESRVAGLIDFGDSHYSACIFDLTICIPYILIFTNNIASIKKLIEGYQKIIKISDCEKKILKTCVCTRFVQSLVIGLYSASEDPDNKYISSNQETGWVLLKKIISYAEKDLLELWGL